ncbi:MAG: protein translocase subunit SecD, partial [Aestuariibacter sp.]|nr:protein translocase subunit SecD [Aestuariibacter sp.]
MLNQNSIFKVLVVLVLVAMCSLYALPNIYGEDNAVQISASRNSTVTEALESRVSDILAANDIAKKSIEFENEQILIRLNDSDSQLRARDLLDRELGDDYVVAMNLAADTPEWLESLGGEPMKLGLDLRGGVHFLMEVDMNEAIAKALEDAESDFRTALREEKLRYRAVNVRDGHIDIQFRDEETLDKAEFFLENRNRDLTYQELDGLVLRAQFAETKLAEIRDYAVKQNITIIRNRVNQLGVAEPVVQKQGAERIVVQLPGIQDTARAKEILNATATLEFRMVDQDNDVRDAQQGRVPPGSQLLNDKDGRPVLLKKRVIVKGNHIIDANSGVDEYGLPQVSISLDSEGGNKMSRGSRENIGEPMATVFIEYKATGDRDANGKLIFERHEEVINVATIRSQFGSSFRITGLDSPKEARDLSLLLRAGALIAPIQIVEERTVGPSLGQENIDLGMQAIIWGLALVMVFMLIYYKAFGIVANIALAV